MTSVLSITHRATGIVLGVGAVVLTVWLLALAGGPDSYRAVRDVLGSIIGRLFLFGFTLALNYHLCNGIRHLFWDAGYGYELETAYASGKAVIAVSIILTLFVWALAYAWRSA